LFEFDNIEKIDIETIDGSNIYTIDNFFKDPDSILKYLLATPPFIHKGNERPSFNTIHFFEGRHIINDPQIGAIQQKLKSICGGTELQTNQICSNVASFNDPVFNDYKNNYWWPHTDFGYNCLIYMNKFETDGTNIYEEVSPEDRKYLRENKINEHQAPWRSKRFYNIIKTIPAKYNRLVMFDGKKFLHNMAINDDTFFHQYRLNLALFFK
jgi:hypothetical protein